MATLAPKKAIHPESLPHKAWAPKLAGQHCDFAMDGAMWTYLHDGPSPPQHCMKKNPTWDRSMSIRGSAAANPVEVANALKLTCSTRAMVPKTAGHGSGAPHGWDPSPGLSS